MSPLPRSLARANKKALNRVMGHLAPRLPGFAMLTHTGRRTGRRYTIPVNAFRRGDRWLFALTYGSGSDWVRNVLASGTATIEVRGERIELHDPHLEVDPTRTWAPVVVRQVLGVIDCDEVLTLREVSE